MDAHGAVTIRSPVAGRGLLLRGQHRAARAARPLPGRDRARARRAAVRAPRCSCSTTPRTTARPGRPARHPVVDRGHRAARSGAARARTTPRCSSAPAAASASCSTRTPSCAPGRPPRCTRRSTERPRAGAAGATLLRPDGAPPAVSAWRFPTPGTALVGALFLHRRLTVQSRGDADAEGRLGPVRRAARPRRGGRARSAGSTRRSSSTPTRSTSASACPTRAGRTLYVPGAEAVHHEQLSTGAVPERRIVELSRNRDRYMRKHHSAAGRAARCAGSRPGPTRCAPPPRSSLPGHDAAALLAPRHRDAAPRPGRGPARGGGRVQPRAPAVAPPAARASRALR